MREEKGGGEDEEEMASSVMPICWSVEKGGATEPGKEALGQRVLLFI